MLAIKISIKFLLGFRRSLYWRTLLLDASFPHSSALSLPIPRSSLVAANNIHFSKSLGDVRQSAILTSQLYCDMRSLYFRLRNFKFRFGFRCCLPNLFALVSPFNNGHAAYHGLRQESLHFVHFCAKEEMEFQRLLADDIALRYSPEPLAGEGVARLKCYCNFLLLV